ncbi:MAG: hypothetical protein KDK89_05230 [Alphaproteobacteria bacterium]|nr:hypothetical protein [Alphaproteobacteria bacterium]
MRKIRLALSLSCLLIASFPLRAAEVTLTTIPSTAAHRDKDLWRRAMTAFYGPYDKTQKCWVGNFDGRRFCMRPHKLQKVSAGQSTRYFLAIGGKPLDEDNSCHACAGAMGLFVLSDATPMLGLVARNDGYEAMGSWGDAPPEENVDIHRIGTPDTFAWTIRTGWTGQGVMSEVLLVRGLVGERVVDLGQIPLSYSDEGNCEDGTNLMTGEKCSSVTFEPVYAAEGGRFGDILLKASGLYKGESLTATYRMLFNAQTMAYGLPENFPEGLSP